MMAESISTKFQPVGLFDILAGDSRSEVTDSVSPRDGIESTAVMVTMTMVGVCRRQNVQ